MVEAELRAELRTRNGIIDQLRTELRQRARPVGRMLVLDTESFYFNVEGEDVLLPLQLAWGIYEWNDQTRALELVHDRTIYVSELMCLSEYRNSVKAVSERCFRRHEEKMTTAGFPLMTAIQGMAALSGDIHSHDVGTVVGYNLSWDFRAIGGLVRRFLADTALDAFDAGADNPLNPLGLRYLDLMHEVVKRYGEELALAGIRDGTVHRAQTSDRIMLRKGARYSKSIYSAEYVLRHFFGVTQLHMADDDVRYEMLLLQKCIQDCGDVSRLEYNILYPQQSCYQRMLHVANAIGVEDEEGFVVPDNSEEECMFTDSDDGDVNLQLLAAVSLLEASVHLPSSDDTELASSNDK